MAARIAGSVLVLVAVLAASEPARAALELPAPSPLAKVSQRVGLTDITVEYSSPGVKRRQIWGKLVPWDKPWRTGANASTKLTTNRDIRVGGKPLPAGTYSIVTIPRHRGRWTVALNKTTELRGTSNYKPAEDVLRIEITAVRAPMRERMSFIFADYTDAGAVLNLEWERRRLSIPIAVDTQAQASAAIDEAVDSSWRTYANAARYLLTSNQRYGKALDLVETSLQLKTHWYNSWVKASLLAGKKRYKEAYQWALKAKQLGERSERFFFREQVESALKQWQRRQ